MDAPVAKKILRKLGTEYVFEVAKGNVPGNTFMHKHGHNADVSTATQTLWSYGGNYIYPASATILIISCSSANDTAAGTGAQSVEIFGLDANYNSISEIVATNGQSSALTSSAFLRVNEIEVVSVGVSGENREGIYCGIGALTSGVPSTVYGHIDDGWNKSTQLIYTVPANKYALLLDYKISNSASKEASARLLHRDNENGGVFLPIDHFRLYQETISHELRIPDIFSPKTDIEVKVNLLTGPSDFLSGHLEFLLVNADLINISDIR